MEFPALKKQIIKQWELHRPNCILIENAGPGLHLLQEFRTHHVRGMPRPIGCKPEGSKLERMDAQSVRFESGQVHFPKEAPWLADLMNELLAFPHAKHDDQVDSISQLLKWAEMKRRNRGRVSSEPPILIELDD